MYVWMTKNLDVSTFRNGDPIPEAKSEKEWENAAKNQKPAWCYYDNDVQNGKKYGKLYNWYAVNDSRGLAPKGYHIPSESEWNLTIKFNYSLFNGLPGGLRYHAGSFEGIGDYCKWWSSSEIFGKYTNGDKAYSFSQSYPKGKIKDDGFTDKGKGLSVRCIKSY
jgi:hypothetical protein